MSAGKEAAGTYQLEVVRKCCETDKYVGRLRFQAMILCYRGRQGCVPTKAKAVTGTRVRRSQTRRKGAQQLYRLGDYMVLL